MREGIDSSMHSSRVLKNCRVRTHLNSALGHVSYFVTKVIRGSLMIHFLFRSWWSIARHLVWSLLGIAELDPLESLDGTSVVLVYVLYGLFLIMGVILLVNMMVALLSNTYQRVQVNAFDRFELCVQFNIIKFQLPKKHEKMIRCTLHFHKKET